MSNSPLVEYCKLSPNHSGVRLSQIDRITPHCVVGQCSIESLGALFADPSRKASSNYGIDRDGKIGMFVEENKRSWCSSSSANDNRAVTIECASDTLSPYAMNDSVYKSLVRLCADICKRNNKNVLLWISNKSASLNYAPKPNEMVLTVHRWFANKSCPGDWLYSRLGELATEVNKILSGQPEPPKPVTPPQEKPFKPYLVKIITIGVKIKAGAYANARNVGVINPGVYTIVEESTDKNGVTWGKLKSGAGWICLDYADRV